MEVEVRFSDFAKLLGVAFRGKPYTRQYIYWARDRGAKFLMDLGVEEGTGIKDIPDREAWLFIIRHAVDNENLQRLKEYVKTMTTPNKKKGPLNKPEYDMRKVEDLKRYLDEFHKRMKEMNKDA
jgi:hypothetical protein